MLPFQLGLDMYDLSRARRAGETFDNPLESRRVAGASVVVETPVSVPETVELVRREFAVDLAGSLSLEEADARNAALGERGAMQYEYPHYLVSDQRR